MKYCKFEGCSNKYFALDYCQKHYTRFKKYGDPFTTKRERHRMRNTPEYKSWSSMKYRCYNKKYKGYKNYGGRGITVCDRWLHSFVNFYEDMGSKPFPGAQLDRRENNKGYCKNNCRWVTNAKNSRNRRNNVVNVFTVKSIRRLFALKKYTHKQLRTIYRVKQGTLEEIIYNRRWKGI